MSYLVDGKHVNRETSFLKVFRFLKIAFKTSKAGILCNLSFYGNQIRKCYLPDSLKEKEKGIKRNLKWRWRQGKVRNKRKGGKTRTKKQTNEVLMPQIKNRLYFRGQDLSCSYSSNKTRHQSSLSNRMLLALTYFF